MLAQENQFICMNGVRIFNLNTCEWWGKKRARKNPPCSRNAFILNSLEENNVVRIVYNVVEQFGLEGLQQHWHRFQVVEFYPLIQDLLLDKDGLIWNVIENDFVLSKKLCDNAVDFKYIIKNNIKNYDEFHKLSVAERQIYSALDNPSAKIAKQIFKICKQNQYRTLSYISAYETLLAKRLEYNIDDVTPVVAPFKAIRQLEIERDKQAEAIVEKRIKWLQNLKIEGCTLKAEAAPKKLAQLGFEMHNCIGDYYQAQLYREKLIVVCTENATGYKFAFTLHNTEKIEALSILGVGNEKDTEDKHVTLANNIQILYKLMLRENAE